jgi:hypothetical protein
VDAVGIVNQFDSSSPFTGGFQVLPRATSDLTLYAPTTDVGDGRRIAVARLLQNAPNPFGRETSIAFEVPGAVGGSDRAQVRLSVFDLQGRLVKTLLDEPMGAGEHALRLSAASLGDAPNGIYFYRLEVGDEIFVRKMVLIR